MPSVDPFAVIKGHHHKGMDTLPLQVLVLKGISPLDILQVLNDNVPADTEIPGGGF